MNRVYVCRILYVPKHKISIGVIRNELIDEKAAANVKLTGCKINGSSVGNHSHIGYTGTINRKKTEM